MYDHNLHTDRTYSHHRRQQRAIPLSKSTPWYQSIRVWRYRGLSGALARGTHYLTPAASRRFPMDLGDTAGAICAQISSLDAVQAATAAHTMHQSTRAFVLCAHPEPGLQVWGCSTDYCWKQQHTTNTFCPTCAANLPYVHPASCRITMWPHSNWLKLFKRSTYSTAGHGCTLEWMLQTLFTSQRTTVTACRVKTEGTKTGLLGTIQLSMTMTNESLTLQPLSVHILYPGANEHSPWGSDGHYRMQTIELFDSLLQSIVRINYRLPVPLLKVDKKIKNFCKIIYLLISFTLCIF